MICRDKTDILILIRIQSKHFLKKMVIFHIVPSVNLKIWSCLEYFS